jgi:flagellar biosynthesis/type III secretory pathway chaperone
MMTVEDRLLLEALCTKIARETDNRKFTELVQELIKLLERCRQKPQNPTESRGFPPRCPGLQS